LSGCFFLFKTMKMNEIGIQHKIIAAIQELNELQQLKLLEFIEVMNFKKKKARSPILEFAGMFSNEDAEEMEKAILDCEKIDEDEW
jgi:hypothetical protein